jgi:acetyl-CoA synthetase
MTPSKAFRQARDLLMQSHGDPDRASASFRWPELQAFNWTSHWFDDLAEGNRRPALRVVTDNGAETVSFAEILDRSRRVAGYLRAAGVQRGDRILLMLTNVIPLWETMLAAIRLGAVVIPATPQLTSADIDDRIERGGARHMITDPHGAICAVRRCARRHASGRQCTHARR